MTWENRLALDMILAEKGQVCVMIGVQCCIFILNNTALDGTITKALQGLNALTNELTENSGVMTCSQEGWKMFIASLVIVLGVLTIVRCCIIPCVQGLL
jgi:hypothetical protein